MEWVTRSLKTPIPSTVVSLQPTTINWIVNDIVINRRRAILELGAGTSTQIVAQCLRQLRVNDGLARTFVSVEENADWVAHLQRIIAADGNTDFVRLEHVPRAQGPGGFWYDEQRLNAVLGELRPDVLVIDGPAIKRVKQTADRSRVYAFFRDRMAPGGYIIFVDDTIRAAERQLAEEWGRYAGVRPIYWNAYLGVISVGPGFTSMPN